MSSFVPGDLSFFFYITSNVRPWKDHVDCIYRKKWCYLQNGGSLSCVIKSLTLETEIGLYGCDFFPSELLAPCGPGVRRNFCCWFCRDRGCLARWASGSQNCSIGTGSSELGSLKGGPTASGWQASSTLRASWRQWDRYIQLQVICMLSHRCGAEQMAMFTHTHQQQHTQFSFSDKLQFILMWGLNWRLSPT